MCSLTKMGVMLRVLAILVVISLFNIHMAVARGDRTPKQIVGIPYYFVTIHNDPLVGRVGGIANAYEVLERMVAQADAYNIKLTLMFTAQWAEYIVSSPERMRALERWAESGHEIGAHHHSIHHISWDGYSNYPDNIIDWARRQYNKHEPFLGTLDGHYMEVLELLNPEMKTGCVNDETDKQAMPDDIIYDTCSGFANFGRFGQFLDDADPTKGVNDYISVGSFNGIERQWLAHSQITTLSRAVAVQDVFLSMGYGVYGTVNHSSAEEEEGFMLYLDFLHEQDPRGINSRTVSTVIESSILGREYFGLEFKAKHSVR